jgi:phosphatidylglycerol:prolipoprotein diacylglycerol transferase
MLPILFETSIFTLYAYPLFMGLSWGFGYFLTDLIFQKHEIDGNTLLPLYAGLFFSSWSGAKIFYLIFSSKDMFHRHLVSENFWLGGGFVFYGGLIFGIIYYLIISLGFKKFNIKNSKFLLPGLIFGHAIGRVGCFLAGCCFGSECDIFLSVRMHGSSLHPVQLYEAFGLIAYWFNSFKKY